MDSIAAIKSAIYELLTEDETLQTIFGGTVRVENNWPAPDEAMPYIVYLARSAPVTGLDIMASATFTLDVFDENSTGARIASIRQRVYQLLDGAVFDTEDGHFRVRRQLDQEVPEAERYVWHLTSDWVVRYTRQKEATYAAG